MRSRFTAVMLGALLVLAAACASSSSSTGAGTGAAMSPMNGSDAPTNRVVTNDPRVGLKPGRMDSTRKNMSERAAEAIWNLRLLSSTPPSPGFVGVTNSDLAFHSKYVIQGNYNGYQVWDVSNPAAPRLATAMLCPASQSDVSVYKNLLFVSSESQAARLDCGTEPIRDTVSHDRIRGIRIFDITDITKPKYLTNVQTCRGSHTHTVVPDLKDPSNVYIYISGSAGVRPIGELQGCEDLASPTATSEAFRIEVIKVPVANPQQASLVSAPRIFQGLTAPPRSNARAAQDSIEQAVAAANRNRVRAAAGLDTNPPAGRGGRGGGPPRIRQGPTQCHDITVYPEIGYAGGACGGYGLLLDIHDVANPKRVGAVADSNFSYWHSATFSNDGSKVLFTDEWGGGGSPKCRATDKFEWGADAMFTITGTQMNFKGYYKMPAAQTMQENCVAHNGSLIPIPGRDIMVQGWYQGGISMFDWTDPTRPKEIAFHDRGPLDSQRMLSGGSWSVYWFNGLIVSSEIARGLDIFELVPSQYISQNEIDAAKTVRFEYLNAQDQQKFVWPPSFSLARAYLDQLERNKGLASSRISSVRSELSRIEGLSGAARRDPLTQLSTQLHTDARSAGDQPKAHLLATAIGDLGNAQR